MSYRLAIERPGTFAAAAVILQGLTAHYLVHDVAPVGPGTTVLVHAGAEEAIFLFLHAALGPGDHAVVHTPCYQSLADVARSTASSVTPGSPYMHEYVGT